MQRPLTYRRQKGVVLFVALIALVVLMIAAVALVRSTDTAQMIAGNLAIKRDLTHESEAAVQAAIARFTGTGTLAAEAARWNDVSSANADYSATALSTSPQGIPFALMQATVAGETAGYNSGVTYRYMIDRMCPQSGSPSLPTAYCINGSTKADVFISDINTSANAGAGLPKKNEGVVYRISIRITDARSTQSFFQTTFMSIGS